jgi:zinc protease
MFIKRWLAGLFGTLLLATGTVQAVPKIQHWQTTHGARVYFVPAPDIPMVDVRVVFDAGGARDDAYPGLANLTNRLLADGAGNLDANQVAESFETRGAQLGYGSARDMAWVSLRSLSDPKLLQPALETLALMLRLPTFGEAGFKRERDRMLTAVRQQRYEPDEITEKRFYAAAYGQHPYASPPEGTDQSLQALTRDQVKAFHARYYVAGNAIVAIVGALTRPQAEALAAAVMGSLPRGEPAPMLPEVPILNGESLVAVAFPSSQTHVRMGQPALTRDDPDYFPLSVGNHVLGGGGLVSRINRVIREERGLSYSVYSYVTPMRCQGPFAMALQTKNAQADEAIELLRQNLRRFVNEGPTEKELEAAKQNIIGGFPLRIDSNAELVDYLTVIGFYHLPLDWLETYTTRVAQVTREQVRDAFKRRIHPERLVVVRVGEHSKGQ